MKIPDSSEYYACSGIFCIARDALRLFNFATFSISHRQKACFMLWREKVERSSNQIQSMMKNVIKREQCKLACGLPNVNILSKVTKFKVQLYLKKGSTDKRGKAPVMGRITLNNSMAQFSCKISCTPELWNSRSGRLDVKSHEAVEVNAKIDRLLQNINTAYDNLLKRGKDFTAQDIKEMM